MTAIADGWCGRSSVQIETMPISRRQLTLFVPVEGAAKLEACRRVLDPVQHGLIAAHVTLCREHELEAVDLAALRARARLAEPIILTFGLPESFSGHGILLPAIAGEGAFHNLRCHLLGAEPSRRQQPHLTLAHPRNPKAPGNTHANLSGLEPGLAITFGEVSLIEQVAGEPWVVLETFELSASGG